MSCCEPCRLCGGQGGIAVGSCCKDAETPGFQFWSLLLARASFAFDASRVHMVDGRFAFDASRLHMVDGRFAFDASRLHMVDGRFPF